jgi:glucokinase
VPAPTLGIDVGGTKCLGVVVDEKARVVAEHRVLTPERGPELIEAILAVVDVLRAEVGPGDVGGVGVGVPGLVDARGALRFAPNLPSITELDVAAPLAAHLGDVPFHIDNDATCAGWAETVCGAGRGGRDVLLATLGTGIGGGLVSGGRLLRGANGFAGEIGHMVVDPSGPPCPCGQRGCWERFASGSALARMATEAMAAGRATVTAAGPDDIRGEHVTAAAAQGDALALELLDRFGWWLALGLANLANMLDPAQIIIGGGLIESGDVILSPTRRAFHDLVEGVEHRPEIPIVAAALGARAGAIGAALLARPAT